MLLKIGYEAKTPLSCLAFGENCTTLILNVEFDQFRKEAGYNHISEGIS
jgi:hypothetical protein